MVFSVVVYGCESSTIKKVEHQRIDAFELWCWRRLLRVPWTAGRSNQSILNEISPEYSLEGLVLKLNLQYFGHLMWRTDSLEKTLILGKIEGGRKGDDRGWDGWIASLTRWTWVWASLVLDREVGDGQGSLMCCSSWVTKSWTRLSDLTEMNSKLLPRCHNSALGPRLQAFAWNFGDSLVPPPSWHHCLTSLSLIERQLG